MRLLSSTFAVLLGALLPAPIAISAESPGFNYAEALQKTFYFLEAQQSGELSPNNRVSWRGPACLTDGKDIGKNLSGGWYDAGDHWTANLTMSFTAMTLAWSAVEHPEGYMKSGQMDELLESLIHVNRYFLKCLLNPEATNPADFEVAIGCGGREGVPNPAVHGLWAAAEVAHLMTNRPTFRLTKQVPGSDIPGAMAAAMAASSIVIREHVDALKGKRGYENFDVAVFADQLLSTAEKFYSFARPHVAVKGGKALRSDGEVVEIGYRADGVDKLVASASWLARAYKALGKEEASRKWFDEAVALYDDEHKKENNYDWYKDYSAGNFSKLAAFNLMRLAPDEEKFHAELQLYCSYFCDYKQTPGGLRLREWYAHEYGSLRHANNAAAIAMYYSEHVASAPKLSGNTWWKKGRTNEELREQYFTAAKSQVDYALGANPYGRSYLVGFGTQPFNHVHHRGAYGAWAGFHHLIKDKPEYRQTNRHVLYGALVAGPDHNDVFLSGKEQRPWMQAPAEKGGAENTEHYRFPNHSEPIARKDYQWNPEDQPLQDVEDSKFNEVALDYNAGITASLTLLTSRGLSAGNALPDTEFPPKDERNDSLDLIKSDREFFVAAKETKADFKGTEIEATVYNRSRWPSKITEQLSFRYYFTLDGDISPESVQAKLSQSDEGAALGPVTAVKDKLCFVEIRWPGVVTFPGNRDKKDDFRRARLQISAPEWDSSNDWSHEGLGKELALLPNVPVFNAGTQVGGEQPK